MTAINNLIKEFNKIKQKNWIKGRTNNYNESGLLLEYLLIKENNNNPWADTNKLEIKTKIKNNNHITLFSLEPNSDFCEIEKIKTKYNKEKEYFNYKLYGNKFTEINNYDFKILISYREKRIYICICKNYKLYEKKVYWTFTYLQKRLIEKLDTLMLINVEKKSIEGNFYYKYTDYKLYKNIIFNNFLKLIDNGKIEIKFNVGKHKGHYKNGKFHNHGTAFIIDKNFLDFLYEKKE